MIGPSRYGDSLPLCVHGYTVEQPTLGDQGTPLAIPLYEPNSPQSDDPVFVKQPFQPVGVHLEPGWLMTDDVYTARSDDSPCAHLGVNRRRSELGDKDPFTVDLAARTLKRSGTPILLQRSTLGLQLQDWPNRPIGSRFLPGDEHLLGRHLTPGRRFVWLL